MKDTIYDRIWNRYNNLSNDFYEIAFPQGKIKENDDRYYFELENSLKNNLEFDKFKKKYTDSWINCFKNLYNNYNEILENIDQVVERYTESNNDQRKFSLLLKLRDHVLIAVVELEFFLKIETDETPETENQEQSKPIATPRGETCLNREQTALLFFWLREKQLIAQSTNGNMAKAINLLSGYEETPMQNIIKSPGTPTYKLGKDQNRLTEIDYKRVINQIKRLLEYIEKDFEINKDNIGTI